MKLIKNILVALDFRDSTETIVSNAMMFAKKFKSKVTLIHILPENIENEKVGDLVKKAAHEELEKINERFKKENIEMGEPILKFGNYSDRIVFASKETGASLIILGAGEKKNKDSYQLGTTAGKVMRRSSKPVFVIKNNQDLTEIKNILCPVDFSDESSHALNNAIAIARLFDSKLVVLSVYIPFVQTITRIDPVEVNSQREVDQELDLKRFLEKHNMQSINYVQEIAGGEPDEEILKAIERHNIDLLSMGTTGRSGFNKILLGSVAEKVTREVLCSFITSKKEDFIEFEIKSENVKDTYAYAQELFEKGFYTEAIELYKASLELNFSHVPSLMGLTKSYEKLGDEENAGKYRKMVKNVIEQFQNFKIEEEVRKSMR